MVCRFAGRASRVTNHYSVNRLVDHARLASVYETQVVQLQHRLSQIEDSQLQTTQDQVLMLLHEHKQVPQSASKAHAKVTQNLTMQLTLHEHLSPKCAHGSVADYKIAKHMPKNYSTLKQLAWPWSGLRSSLAASV